MSKKAKFIDKNKIIRQELLANQSKDEICRKEKLSDAQFKRHLAEIALVAPEILVSWNPMTASLPIAEMPAVFRNIFPRFSKTSLSGIVIKFERDREGTSGIFEIIEPVEEANLSQDEAENK